jgi:hypothetical protein
VNFKYRFRVILLLVYNSGLKSGIKQESRAITKPSYEGKMNVIVEPLAFVCKLLTSNTIDANSLPNHLTLAY